MKIGKGITKFHFIQYPRQTITDLYSLYVFNHVMEHLWHRIDNVERQHYLAIFKL